MQVVFATDGVLEVTVSLVDKEIYARGAYQGRKLQYPILFLSIHIVRHWTRYSVCLAEGDFSQTIQSAKVRWLLTLASNLPPVDIGTHCESAEMGASYQKAACSNKRIQNERTRASLVEQRVRT